ncbi:hypothetical protein [Natrinema pellirubrum]|nr:hypothetical protein [Natrinema pellirubrum]
MPSQSEETPTAVEDVVLTQAHFDAALEGFRGEADDSAEADDL